MMVDQKNSEVANLQGYCCTLKSFITMNAALFFLLGHSSTERIYPHSLSMRHLILKSIHNLIHADKAHTKVTVSINGPILSALFGVLSSQVRMLSYSDHRFSGHGTRGIVYALILLCTQSSSN